MEDRIHPHATSLIVRLLHDRTGQTLSEDRRYRVDRAIETVLTKRGIVCNSDLIVLLTQPDGPAVEQELIEALLNNETYFFRDRNVFSYLADRVLPELAQAKATSRELTIWSAGCSTGQEPLSLAMLLLEQGAIWRGWKLRILATDVSESAIAKARAATYSQFEIQRGLAVGQMLGHFEELKQDWRASHRLREMIDYRPGNLLLGSPGGAKFDLILCRNVLLYFDPAARQVAGGRLAEAMAPHSRLLLGSGESVIDGNGLFETVGSDGGVFRLARQAAVGRSAAA
jgi:chemotaxis protein methyltransferase CheR